MASNRLLIASLGRELMPDAGEVTFCSHDTVTSVIVEEIRPLGLRCAALLRRPLFPQPQALLSQDNAALAAWGGRRRVRPIRRVTHVTEENNEIPQAPKRRRPRARKADAVQEASASSKGDAAAKVPAAQKTDTAPKADAPKARAIRARAAKADPAKGEAPSKVDSAPKVRAAKADDASRAHAAKVDVAPKADTAQKASVTPKADAAPKADVAPRTDAAGDEGAFKRRRSRARKDRDQASAPASEGGQNASSQASGQNADKQQRGYQRDRRDVRPGRGADKQNAQGQRQFQNNNGGNNRRRNRHNNNGNNAGNNNGGPTLSRERAASMLVAELRREAVNLGVEYVGIRKAQLAEAVYIAAARAEGFRDVAGVLDITGEGYGFVRTGNYMAGDDDAFVPQQMIKHMGLRRGDWIEGTVRPSRPNDKYPALYKIAAVNGLEPELVRSRPRFRDLTPVYPNERLRMEHGRDSITGRAIDLVAPIGKGQRGLIVSPPKAGKTTVLKRICESIAANNPEVYLICLLVDERPEEVTDMQRSIKGDVVASTFDMPAENHTMVSELVIERAKRLVEMGRDVVVVLDSITRLARAYNLAAPASGRILSGGVDSAALYPPKKFLGAARNIENGGSLTILASALVETGSKMDEVIFEEFKGTGNMELKLDRELADKRIFPAIDPVASGTRNEDLLIDADLQPFVWGLRRILANMNNIERAEASLVKSLRATATNEEFLIRSAKKAQQSEYVDSL